MANNVNNDDDLVYLPIKGLPDEYLTHFTGREDVLRTINISLQNLQEGRHHGLHFDGERGIGKSSIFDYLENKHCELFNVLPVKINVVGIKSTAELLEEISREIRDASINQFDLYKIRKILWSIADNFPKISTAWISLEANEKTHKDSRRKEFEGYLEALKKEGVSGILVMLDDADSINISILGEIGHILNEDLGGFVSYISTGTYHVEDIKMEEDGQNVKIIDETSGILAYWERVELRLLDDNEMSTIIDGYLEDAESILLDDEVRELLISLSGGNGRLLMLITQMAGRYGLEVADGKKYLRITQEVVDNTLKASDRLAPKLQSTISNVEARDPDAIKPRWW